MNSFTVDTGLLGLFSNRREAGRLLALLLRRFSDRSDVVVLALPRGGVPVAYEVAASLEAPLDVFTVRKLGVPHHEELAMGAIGSGAVLVLNEDIVAALDISREQVAAVVEREQRELERREQLYRDNRPYPDLARKTVILIDDGLATGASMLAAVNALRRKQVARIVVAIPIAPPEGCRLLGEYADEVVAYFTSERFGGVGVWYDDFAQVSDQEVRGLLEQGVLCKV